MTRDELLAELRKFGSRDRDDEQYHDNEEEHIQADALLLKFIDDPEITAVFEAIYKWYS